MGAGGSTSSTSINQMGSTEGVISLGPWGGQGGISWSCRASLYITAIVIHHDSGGIHSISFTDATGLTSGKFGGNGPSGAAVERKIEIRAPSEYLKSISGTYGNYNSTTAITSLSFTTNFSTYGPYGNANGGDSFSVPIVDSLVVGFFGRAGFYLDAIGIFVQPAPSQGSISLGPWGGSGGDTAFSFRVGSWIKQITLRTDSINVKAISFIDANGRQYGAFGGTNPNDMGTERTVVLNGPSEYLVTITGTYGTFAGMTVITSLSFVTNMSTHGPFGGSSGTAFSLPILGSFVRGFFGRSGHYLDSIGIHCEAAPPGLQDAVSLGPWGGPGGIPWSYITNRGINEIAIHTGANIKSISFHDASDLASETFGGNNPNDLGQRNTVHINWPSEYLISISGTNGAFAGMSTITSLSFTTNLTTYGPYGTASGIPFSIPISNSTVVGFHGRAGHYLDAIGIFVKQENVM